MFITALIKRFRRDFASLTTNLLDKAAMQAKAHEALLQAAHSQFDLGRYSEALTAYLELIGTAPRETAGLFKLYVNIGNCHEILGQFEEAVGCYNKALDLYPDCVEAHWNLVILFRRLGKEHLAAVHQSRLEQVQLGPTLSLREILDIPVIAPSAVAIDEWRTQFAVKLEELAAQPGEPILQPETTINATTLYLAYQGQNDVKLSRQVCTTIRRFYMTGGDINAKPVHNKRIRIGFVSSFFFNHSIGRLYRGVIRALDRSKFEVFVFSIDHQKDETASLIENIAENFFNLPGHVPTIADAIRNQQLNVLYYPEIGLHPVTYFLAYWRLAPVQCMSYGHPVTSGIDTIDYFLSASSIDSEAHQAHYTEKLVRLEGFFMPAYERPTFPSEKLGPERFGAENGQHIYFCPQTLFKFHPDFDSVLHDILKRDSTAILTLIDTGPANWRPALMQRFTQVMPDVVSRVRFIPSQSTADYVNLLKSADVVLDTLNFGGGISVMDAFSANVPIVTLEGQFFRGRQAAACYREMGMEDCISHTPETYVERALVIGNDPRFRAALIERIAQANSRLFNRVESIRSLESFLTQAVAQERSAVQ
jgi:predicted O-linked N-acetylglucosamine transferase (SPINDLY family)